jgi:hypothetical protein
MAKELSESMYPSYRKVLVKSPSRTHALSQTYVNPDEFPFRVYTVNHAKKVEFVYGVFNTDAYAKVVVKKINNGTEKEIDEVYDSNRVEQYKRPKFFKDVK